MGITQTGANLAVLFTPGASSSQEERETRWVPPAPAPRIWLEKAVDTTTGTPLGEYTWSPIESVYRLT